MADRESKERYYGRRAEKTGTYQWIVRIGEHGCFVTDPIEDWEKDDDYREEAISNNTAYEQLNLETAQRLLAQWNRSL